jgi:hypothetical protein
MKKTLLVVLIFLLLMTATFENILTVRAATTEDLWTTPALPEGISTEPMPENYTIEDYLNTTNPYSQVNSLGEEGNRPLYVLVFGDEEERPKLRLRPTIIGPEWCDWAQWAEFQIERGDNALAANFGIDIRILDFLQWNSADSKDSMYDLWYELESDKAVSSYMVRWRRLE